VPQVKQVLEYTRAHADELDKDMRLASGGQDYESYWKADHVVAEARIAARAVAALECDHLIKTVPRTSRKEVARHKAYGQNWLGSVTPSAEARHPSSGTRQTNRTMRLLLQTWPPLGSTRQPRCGRRVSA